MKHIVVGVRFTKEQLELLDKAAQKDERPRSNFMFKYSMEKAKAMLDG